MFPKNVEWILSKLLKVRKKSKCLSMNCFERIDRATFVRCYVATEVNRREVRQNGERPSGFTVDRASYNWSCVHRPCCMLSKKTKKHNDCNADGRNSWSVMRAERSLRPSLSANLFPWTLIRKRQIKQPTSVELKRVTLRAKLAQFSHDWSTKNICN